MQSCAVVLVAVVALVGAQHPTHQPPETHTCNCGAFITLDHAEYEIHRLPPFDALSCDDIKECKTSCAGEWKKMTGNGDLEHELANGFTVGQELCIGLNNGHGIDSCYKETVYVFSNTCDGPWIWDGVNSIDELCCHDGHYHDCSTLPPHPPQ
ncbi:unnamed protein product [Meganyctiphanes norvegica]|uniref:Uncharacterized protein n=1 Tax=Meganyctiphanes norvegica TaxID=48144 RepID=A0AAV2QI02_MEGNR